MNCSKECTGAGSDAIQHVHGADVKSNARTNILVYLYTKFLTRNGKVHILKKAGKDGVDANSTPFFLLIKYLAVPVGMPAGKLGMTLWNGGRYEKIFSNGFGRMYGSRCDGVRRWQREQR